MRMKLLRTFLIVGTILVAGAYGLYRILFRLLEKGMLKTKPNGQETPGDAGLEYEEINVRSGNRRLQAWYVRAAPSNDAQKAILVYHGVEELISDWIPAMRFLWENGISSMVFDYSGFGSSDGRASLANLRQDAQAAYRTFMSKTGKDAHKYGLGYSLGTGVLLEAAPDFACQLDGTLPDSVLLVRPRCGGQADCTARLHQIHSARCF